MSLIISSYDKNLKNNRIDSNTDNIHDHFYNKLLFKPKIMYDKEPEIYKYIFLYFYIFITLLPLL